MSTVRNPAQEVVDWASDATEPEVPAPTNGATFNLESFIQRHLVVRRGPLPWDSRGRKWELETCPFNAEHTGGCAVVTQTTGGVIGFKCQHHGCADKHWRDVRELFDGPRRGIGGVEHELRDGAGGAAVSATEAKIDDDTLPDFPEIAWRGAFADYRQAMAGTTEASDVAHFSAFWAAAAVTLGRRVFMYAGERIFANVYLSVFGPTGDKKTTAQRRILNCGLLAPSIRVIRNLGSTEGLADALKREDGADIVALFFWEELTVLFARGRWTGSTILEFITETFDCPPEWGMKYRKDPINLVAPTPTILAGTTCEWFWKNARSDDFFGGLGNRFLYMTGPKKKPIPNPSEPDGAALQRVRDALVGLSELHPVEARFDMVARRLWERFYMSWEQRERTGLYAAAVKRVHVYIRKLAMTYAALEGTLPVIGIEQLKAAIAVGVYAAECAKTLVNAQNAILRPEGELEQKFLKCRA